MTIAKKKRYTLMFRRPPFDKMARRAMKTPQDYFECPACGKRLDWYADEVGKEMHCACDAFIKIPPRPQMDLYDIAPSGPAPRPGVVAAMPIEEPSNVIRYASKVQPAKQELDLDHFKHWTLPLWVIGGGIAIEFTAALIMFPRNAPMIMQHVVVDQGLATVAMMLGLWIAAYFRGIDIGPPHSALVRIAAVSIAPGAVGDLLLPLTLHFPPFVFVQVGAAFCIWFAMLGVMFDLQEGDTWTCVFLYIAIWALAAVAMRVL